MNLLQPVRRRAPLLAGTAAAFVLGVFASLLLQGDGLLYDNDAYYHLAVARLYGQEGIVSDLEAVRFSLLREGFGDKELLFHVLLIPFAGGDDPMAGGRLALALLHGLLAAAIGGLGLRLAGWWALLVPFWLPYASTELAWRLVRLRPELGSLLLLLAGIWAMGRGRYRLLGLLAAVYTLSYTAFHAFVGLAVLFFLVRRWRSGRWEPAAVLYPILGAGLGLLLHPHFPKILQIWLVQNVQFFFAKGVLDVGTEIRPNFTDVVLMVNLGWLLALAVAWGSTEEPRQVEGTAEPPARADAGLADALGLGAVVFGVLYLLMSRFVLYVVPMASLWLLAELGRRGRRVVPWTRLPLFGRVPAVVALAVALLVSLPEARRQLGTFRARTSPGPEAVRVADRAAVGAVLPEGARVAAPWRQTPIYMLWAPQGRYLNVLDPVFMATSFPEHDLAWNRVWHGVEPDVPWSVVALLDSEYLAYSLVRDDDPLLPRLEEDPRVEVVYRGFNAVFRFVPGRNQDLVLDWRLAPEGWDGPVPEEMDISAWPAAPRSPDPVGRAVEGYVDLARRLPPTSGCRSLVHDLLDVLDPVGGQVGGNGGSAAVRFELAPSGPSTLWLDDELLLVMESDLGAVLGRGVDVELDAPSTLPVGGAREPHRLTVRTCPSARGELGFYLRRRSGNRR